MESCSNEYTAFIQDVVCRFCYEAVVVPLHRKVHWKSRRRGTRGLGGDEKMVGLGLVGGLSSPSHTESVFTHGGQTCKHSMKQSSSTVVYIGECPSSFNHGRVS